jgi:hypothetical protein
MSEKRLSMVDTGQFEDAAIIQDDDKLLVMRAVIASEIVQQYQDSRTGKPFFAYKSADELEKAAWTADGRWVKVLAHPKSSSLDSVEDVNGKMMNPVFRKDLNDPKTNRPCRRGIQVDVAWFKDRTPKEVIDRARRMEIKDNSIGFTCFNDPTPGEFQGQHYDVVQRNIFIDHLAAPIEKGRCPSPYCGINVDSAEDLEKPVITVQDADLGISYVFDKAKFTDEQAKTWVAKRTVKDCPVCTRMLEAGLLTAGQRLYKQYGADILEVVEGHTLPPVEPQKILVNFRDVSDAMTPVQIDAKIQELHSQYDALRVKEKAFYETQKLEPSPQLQKLYQQMGDIDNEIKAFTELKAKKIVEGNNDSAVADGKDDVILKNRQALKDLYSLTEIFT